MSVVDRRWPTLMQFAHTSSPPLRNGDVVFYVGALRSGKTMSAVADALASAAPIRANIDVAGATRVETVTELLAPAASLTIVVWDEIQATLNAREFAKSSNIDISKTLIYLGKRNLALLATAPSWLMVDVNLRRLATRVVHVVRRSSDLAVRYEYSYNSVTDSLTPRATRVLRYARYRGLYDTLSESVVLRP